VRADGTVARGGGKVVKNVAGFDVPKLMVGTFGTLAMIGTVTFRLHPRPQETNDVIFSGCDAAAVRRLVVEITRAQLEPSAIFAIFDGTLYAVCIRFEGFTAGVGAQRDALLAIAGRAPAQASSLDAEHDAARTSGELQVKITAPASKLEEMHVQAIAPAFDAIGGAKCVVYPSAGVGFIAGSCSDAASVLAALAAARSWAERSGGTLVVTQAPTSMRDAFDPWGTPPPSFALMRALKERFDPGRRLNPGGFVGGL
jgi:glycolate oxidase FAD binding subunit